MTFCASLIGYSIYDYQRYYQRRTFSPTPKEEPQYPGRYGGSFPTSEAEYKAVSQKPQTLEEIEWQLQEKQKRYNEFMKNNPTQK